MQRRIRTISFFFYRWFLVCIAAVLLVVLCVLIFSPFMDIREIRIQRTQARVDIETMQQALIPLFRQNILFVSRSDVVSLLRAHMQDLADVTVRKDYPSTLVVNVNVRPLTARLEIVEPREPAQAGSGVVQEAPPQHFEYLADNGVYISLPFRASGASLPLLRIVDWAARPVPGMVLVEPEMLTRMREAEQLLKDQFGQTVRVRAAYLRAREFHLATDKVSLWFDLQSPLAEQLERYRIFLAELGPSAAREYIDLRLSGRVVYR